MPVVILTTTAAYGQSYAQSTLTLDPIPDWIYAGEAVTFTGTLTSGGSALSGRTVLICEDDPIVPDECLASGTTNHAGRFSIEWIAKAGIVEIDFDIYAEFKGNRQYDDDQTPRYTMSVYKRGGSITLDPIPDRAAYGEVVTFTGTLKLDGYNPEGSVVYIKDEDAFNPDDLLVSAYVEASGRFTTIWMVEDVDPDYTIDIQAAYDGSSLHHRQATPINGLTAYYGTPEPEPEPGPTGDGYMELYRSLDFEQPPRVAIVPSPDSYEEVRKHIIPVQEGIWGLTAMLEQKYPGGNWDVDFDVVRPGDSFDTKPDVKIDLVARGYEEEDSLGSIGCDVDRYGVLGWAYHTAPKPVPTVVCSLDSLTNADIGATAAHEFIHAIGLGHTFNIPGDMMCSEEDGKPTCPGGTGYKSTTPSDLNLDALVAIYGADGFQNPNNDIMRNERFTLGDSPSSGLFVSQPGVGMADEQISTVIFTDLDLYKEGEVILVDGVYLGDHEELLSLYLADQYGDVVDVILVSPGVVIEEFFFGVYSAGTYTVWLYDEYDWVEGNSFEILGVDDAVLYADEIWYSPGDLVYLDGFYWGSYNGWSEVLVLDPFGNVVEWVDMSVVQKVAQL